MAIYRFTRECGGRELEKSEQAFRPDPADFDCGPKEGGVPVVPFPESNWDSLGAICGYPDITLPVVGGELGSLLVDKDPVEDGQVLGGDLSQRTDVFLFLKVAREGWVGGSDEVGEKAYISDELVPPPLEQLIVLAPEAAVPLIQRLSRLSVVLLGRGLIGEAAQPEGRSM